MDIHRIHAIHGILGIHGIHGIMGIHAFHEIHGLVVLVLHYLYDLFHPHDGYGGVEKPINMDSDSNNRVLSTKELIFMSFTTLRALNGIMHGHVDHIPITMHDVKHAMLTLVKNMEIATRE